MRRIEQITEHQAGEPQPSGAGLHVSNGIGESRSVWLTTREAAIYVGNASVAGFRRWAQRRGLVPNGRGQFARRDLDRAIAVPRKRHQMSAVSLANLRHGRQSAASTVAASTSEHEVR